MAIEILIFLKQTTAMRKCSDFRKIRIHNFVEKFCSSECKNVLNSFFFKGNLGVRRRVQYVLNLKLIIFYTLDRR